MGLTPFAAEWWHVNDVDARTSLGDLSSITGDWELTTSVSILKAVSVTGGGEILIESDDYENSTGSVRYPHVIIRRFADQRRGLLD